MIIHQCDHATTSRYNASGMAAGTVGFYREICTGLPRSGHISANAANDMLSGALELVCQYFQTRSHSHTVFASEATEV